jgi:hypothetical protein
MWWPAVVKSEWELRLDYGRSPHAYVNQRLQIQLELLMMSGVPLETCWAFNYRWNNKFCYKVASCWLFLLNHATMHESMNIKFTYIPFRELQGGTEMLCAGNIYLNSCNSYLVRFPEDFIPHILGNFNILLQNLWVYLPMIFVRLVLVITYRSSSGWNRVQWVSFWSSTYLSLLFLYRETMWRTPYLRTLLNHFMVSCRIF